MIFFSPSCRRNSSKLKVTVSELFSVFAKTKCAGATRRDVLLRDIIVLRVARHLDDNNEGLDGVCERNAVNAGGMGDVA